MIESLAINSGAAVGSAGVATANATSTHNVVGELLGVYVKYNDSPPSTTDVTIATTGAGTVPALTILTLTNVTADNMFLVRHLVTTAAGAAVAADYRPVVIADTVKVTIAQANAADNVDVTLIYEAGR